MRSGARRKEKITPHWPTGSTGDRCDEKRNLNQHAKSRKNYEGSKLETRDSVILSATLTVELVCVGISNTHLYGSTTQVRSLLECLDMTMIHDILRMDIQHLKTGVGKVL